MCHYRLSCYIISSILYANPHGTHSGWFWPIKARLDHSKQRYMHTLYICNYTRMYTPVYI